MMAQDYNNKNRLRDLYEEGVITKDFVRSLLDKHHISLESYLYIIHHEEKKESDKEKVEKMFDELHKIDEVVSPTGTKYFVGIDKVEGGKDDK